MRTRKGSSSSCRRNVEGSRPRSPTKVNAALPATTPKTERCEVARSRGVRRGTRHGCRGLGRASVWQGASRARKALESCGLGAWHGACNSCSGHAASVRSSTRRPCPRAGACVARGPPDTGVGSVLASTPRRVDRSCGRPATRFPFDAVRNSERSPARARAAGSGRDFFVRTRLTPGRTCLSRRRPMSRRTPPLGLRAAPTRRHFRGTGSRWPSPRPCPFGSTHPGIRSSP